MFDKGIAACDDVQVVDLLDAVGLRFEADTLQRLSILLDEASFLAPSRLLDLHQDADAARVRWLLSERATWATTTAADLRLRAQAADEMERAFGLRMGPSCAWPGPPSDGSVITAFHRRVFARLQGLEAAKHGPFKAPPSVIPYLIESINARQQALISSFTETDWRAIAFLQAGIDPDAWDPDRGLLHNDAIVQSVYKFYGELWLEHPELQWAAMANLVGPMFYGGWQDLYTLRHITDDGLRNEYLLRLTPLPELPGSAYDLIGHLDMPLGLNDLAAGDLAWLETKMLAMHQEIFNDLGWQHAAYTWVGVDAIEFAGVSGDNLRAWQDIASGDAVRVANGNRFLLDREQKVIIQDDYEAIRSYRGPIGEALTYLMTWTASNPIPGGEPYRDVVTRNLEIPSLSLDSPKIWPPWEWVPVDYDPITITVPRGNIANIADRWEWIMVDMVPAYIRLLGDPVLMTEIIETPVSVRADGERLLGVLPYPG